LSILPYALRYKTHKTKLILAPVLKILAAEQGKTKVMEMVTSVMEFIPIKPFLLWLPQVMRLAEV